MYPLPRLLSRFLMHMANIHFVSGIWWVYSLRLMIENKANKDAPGNINNLKGYQVIDEARKNIHGDGWVNCEHSIRIMGIHCINTYLSIYNVFLFQLSITTMGWCSLFVHIFLGNPIFFYYNAYHGNNKTWLFIEF